MIEVSGLRKAYGRTVALDGVDLRVREGEVYGVVGRSGAGKSTLLRCVNLLERPDSGRVRVAGQELTGLGGRDLNHARRRIGMIHQHFALLSSRTVAGNVAFPLEVMGVPRAERRRRVGELLELVGLAGRGRDHPHQLSGGQKQRVGIARALAGSPDVLLSDEATSALDPTTTQSILDLLKRLNTELGLTILLITHEMDVVKNVCDSAAIMAGGRVVESGAIADLIRTPGSRLTEEIFPLPGPAPAGSVTLTFTGDPQRPLVSEVVRKFDVDVSILGGAIEEIAGGSAGRLRVALTGDEASAALDYLRGHGLLVEVS